jgi:molecular chaperone DnaK
MNTATNIAVGIDLGTTYSVLAHVDNSGRPWTVSNAEGDGLTPTAVFFDRSRIVVGKPAVKAAEFEPARVAQFVKRQMGESLVPSPICGRSFPPEVLQALVLRKLRDDARLKLGDFSKAVITVPAYFNEPRRRATRDAGRLAGLDVLDIINEPTAAAIAFGVQHGFLTPRAESRQRETLLVYDLGGGTFDVTMMEIDGRQYRTIATGGDVYLGGMDWDSRIVDHVAERFLEQFGTDPRQDDHALARLRWEAIEAKHALSARDEVDLQFAHDGHRLRSVLSREQFETLTGDLLDRTMLTCRRVLKEAGRSWSDLTRVLLVGGATRMAMVQQMLRAESGLEPDRSLAADEAVAHGAAIYAALQNLPDHPQFQGVSVGNVNSHDLGVLAIEPGTGLRRRRVLIPRNTPLPAVGVCDFVTQRDGQANVRVSVVEGGDITGMHATPIGKCVVAGLPSDLPAHSRVRVSFDYSASGLLTVGAALPGTGRHAAIAIRRTSNLSDEAFAQWLAAIDGGDLLAEVEPAEPFKIVAFRSAKVRGDLLAELEPAESAAECDVTANAAEESEEGVSAEADLTAGPPDAALQAFFQGISRNDATRSTKSSKNPSPNS